MSRTAIKAKAIYGIITPEILSAIFDSRELHADLLSRAPSKSTSHAAKMVRLTLDSVRADLAGIME